MGNDDDDKAEAKEARKVGYLRRSKYVKDDHRRLVKRSALPDTHQKSWPSQYRAVFGKEIPDDWRQRLRTVKEGRGNDDGISRQAVDAQKSSKPVKGLRFIST